MTFQYKNPVARMFRWAANLWAGWSPWALRRENQRLRFLLLQYFRRVPGRPLPKDFDRLGEIGRKR